MLMFLLGTSGVSSAADFWLRAETLTKTMPDSSVVTMWGFAQCADGTYATCSAATVPGPELTVPIGDTTLTIHLRNNLTGLYVEPVSIVIPGQNASILTPVKFTDASGRPRVRSFTAETPPDNLTTVDYVWTSLKPGTYLYQSGTHPAVQIQMGLYGAVKLNSAAGQAYTPTATNPDTTFAADAVLLFSEIDPVLHTHVANGTYGTPPPVGITSTMNYEPKYFLVNGMPYSAAAPALPIGNAGQRTLLRVLNAGLRDHVPVIQNMYMTILANDGNLLPYPRSQYSFLLPAGKTMDAIVVPAAAGGYSIYDRRLSLTNGPSSPGGMLVNLNVSAPIAQIGVFRDGQWYLDRNGNGGFEPGTDSLFNFGIPGDIPVTGDWTGTGTAKAGVFRVGQWYLDSNGNGAWDPGVDTIYNFGIPGDVPVTGDWTGTGTTKIGVVRGIEWYLDIDGNGVWDPGVDRVYAFGIPGDVPVTGDWNSSGTTKIGIFRGGQWYLDANGNGAWDPGVDTIYNFGIPGDVPATGDWNSSGTTKIGIFRGGQWYLDSNGDGAFDLATDVLTFFGIPGDLPVTGRW
jgi:hypothetical protein